VPLHPYKSAEAASDASMVVEAGTLNPDNGKASMRNAQRTAKAPRQLAEKVWKPTTSAVGGCHLVQYSSKQRKHDVFEH
jgi:hypothetical protein